VIIPLVAAGIGAWATLRGGDSGPGGSNGSSAGASTTLAANRGASPTSPSVAATNTSLSSPVYLFDVQKDVGGGVTPGYVSIAGRAYKKGFSAGTCIAQDAVVTGNVPQGAAHFSGVAGYDDTSSLKESSDPMRLIVEVTTDAATIDNKAWVRLDVIQLPQGGHEVASFNESLPSGATQIRISPEMYACGTTIAFGDPVFS
jgi:hypothetical protein